jgi:hypothetical protein
MAALRKRIACDELPLLAGSSRSHYPSKIVFRSAGS